MQHSSGLEPLASGCLLDQFTIDQPVSVFGWGIIYRARETRSGKPFLLLEYAPRDLASRAEDGSIEASDPDQAFKLTLGLTQFLTDAVRAAALVHPAIARVSRWFKANGTAYWVVPGIPGENLASVVESKGQLPASDVAGFAMSLLDGLEYLHDQKVYPSFIDPGSIFLVDSGDALFLGSGNSSAGLSGQISQEESTNPGAPSDIYSLAAVFYYCVTGHKPASAQVRRDALEAGGPDPLVSLEPAANSSQAEREITVLIQRGLVLDPSKRPQSVHEWRARISAGMGGRSRPSEPETPREEREWLPRFLLVVFVVAIFAIAWLLFSPRWSDPETGMGKPGEAELTAARETAEEAERWRQALEANAVIGYRTFLDDFPNSIHTEQAEEHIGLLETKAWPAVLEENTRAGFEAHLEIFPDGQYATQALARIEEFRQEEARLARAEEERQRQDDVAWALARSAGSIAALDGYIAEWPGGSHVAEAHDLRQKMQSGLNDSASFEIATQANTIEAYRRYLQNFPAGRHAAKARESIESLTLSTGKNFRDCTECPLMVVIPAGAFWQGSAEASELAVSLEKPRHRVTIAEPFAVSAFEITMAEWDACAADSGCDTRPQDNGWGRGNRPVIMVSWSDAMQYAAWLSEKTGQVYSLPSESQWEYLARAGEESDWLGGSASAVCDFGNIAGNETSFDWRHTDCEDGTMASTTPAGSHQPNAFGVYDVIGNVAEWTLDCMNLSYLEAPSDGGAWTRGMCSSRMTRGGSWFTGTRESRLAARFNLKNGDRNDFTGFRVVRKVEKQ